MFQCNTVRRLAVKPTATLLSTRLVPVSQPMPGDTTWFTRNPHIGSAKAVPSLDQLVTERVYEEQAKDLQKQGLKAAVKASLDRNASTDCAAEDAPSSSTPAASTTKPSSFHKVNLSEDALNAEEAKFQHMIKDAKVYTHDGQEVRSKDDASNYVHQLDLSAMPDIPGVSKEELALKLLEFQKVKAQQAAAHLSGDMQRNQRVNEIEAMRMSLQPKDFKEFMVGMQKLQHESELELEKMRAMSPQELYKYQQKKQRTEAFWRWMNFWALWVMAFGGTFMIYYIMYEFYAI